MRGLKEKTIRGGFAKVCAQAVTLLLRVGSLMILGRLLEPRDFGLVGMVTAFIGVLNLLRDFGLSSATVQRATITGEQLSTLFWINMAIGAILATVSGLCAPLVAAFYHEPRLIPVTVILATGFLFNAAGVQQMAILERHIRFTTTAVIDIIALAASTAVGVGLAFCGWGYWALVAMTVALPAVATTCLWLTTGWTPGMPSKQAEILSMVRFGGTMTLNNVIVYLAYNFDKVLLGRFWGAAAVGIYGRAYQLCNVPTESFTSSVGGVAFAALSRLQDDPRRLRNYFLKGYSLLLALTLPVTIVCALFAKDLISVLLGPKWIDAAPIFRLLAPTILIFALINPLGWLLYSLGLVGRSLKIALVIAPLVITGYLVGLPYGPKGVAIGYSAAMALWVVPHIIWSLHGTAISTRDIALTLSHPLLSGLVAGTLAFAAQSFYLQRFLPLPRLVLGGTFFLGVYVWMLLYVMRRKRLYLDLLKALTKPSVTGSDTLEPGYAAVPDQSTL